MEKLVRRLELSQVIQRSNDSKYKIPSAPLTIERSPTFISHFLIMNGSFHHSIHDHESCVVLFAWKTFQRRCVRIRWLNNKVGFIIVRMNYYSSSQSGLRLCYAQCNVTSCSTPKSSTPEVRSDLASGFFSLIGCSSAVVLCWWWPAVVCRCLAVLVCRCLAVLVCRCLAVLVCRCLAVLVCPWLAVFSTRTASMSFNVLPHSFCCNRSLFH